MAEPYSDHHDEVSQDLHTAISNLEQFALLNAFEPIPHFYHLELKDGHIIPNAVDPYQKLVGLARCFVTALLSDTVRRDHEQRRDRLQQEILRAIDIVKNSYPLLDKLKNGDAAERKLADAAMATIDHFNSVIEGARDRPPSWGQRFARFLFRRSGLSVDEHLARQTIELPLPASQHCESPQDVGQACYKVSTMVPGIASNVSSKVSSLAAPQQGPLYVSLIPSHREVDAFRVKAITMIRNYGFPSTSLSEALKAVRQTPVQSADTKITKGLQGEATIVTFKQTIEPFPGEVLLLEGSFRRDAHSKVPSIPIPDSFRLFSRSSQSGFPHPIQHAGWGLCDKLLPPCPDYPEKLPLYRMLCDQKRKMAQALLPSGVLLFQAKRLLETQKELFEAYHDEFLTLHRRLASAIARATNANTNNGIIKNLFHFLKGQSAALEQLAQAYSCICDTAIVKPLEYLQNSWLSARASGSWTALTSERRLELSRSMFLEGAQEALERLKAEKLLQVPEPLATYMVFLGQLLQKPACELVLQYMSEKIGFEPPKLSPFAQRLQTATFRQLMAFMVNLEVDLGDDPEEQRLLVKNRLVMTLEADITCFEEPLAMNANKSVTSLRKELADYYHQRALNPNRRAFA